MAHPGDVNGTCSKVLLAAWGYRYCNAMADVEPHFCKQAGYATCVGLGQRCQELAGAMSSTERNPISANGTRSLQQLRCMHAMLTKCIAPGMPGAAGTAAHVLIGV